LGIVKKQAFYNSIFNYIGQVIGYVNIALLFPILLSPEEFGLTRLITSYSVVFAQFSSIGIRRVIVRFFPFFRTIEDRGHHGFLILISAIPALGFIVGALIFVLFKGQIINSQADSGLFGKYAFLIPIAGFLTLCFWVLDSHLKALIRTSLSSFLSNVVLKLLWLISALMYYYKMLEFDSFMLMYFSSHAFLILVQIISLFRSGELNIQWDRQYLRFRVIKRVFYFGFFSIIDDATGVMTSHIDKIIIGSLLGLEPVAIYALSSYISTVINVPATSLNRVLSPLVSRYWRDKKRQEVESLYQKSTLLSFMASGLFAVLIWGNVDSLLLLLPETYRSGSLVILVIMLAQLVEMGFGVNTEIISASKYYWYNSISSFLLIVALVVFNFLFIPIYGIVGAAMATLFSKLIFNFGKFVFLYIKEGLQPFSIQNVKAVIILLVGYGIVELLPDIPINNHMYMENVFNILYKSGIGFAFISTVIYLANISTDVNAFALQIARRGMKMIGWG